MANNCTPNIQAKLNDLYSLKPAEVQAGAVLLAKSTANGAEVQAKMIQQNGKNSQYSITYANADCTAPVECSEFDCADPSVDGGTLTTCVTFNSFSCVSMPARKKLNISSFRDLGSLENMDVFAQRIFSQIQLMKDQISKNLIVDICTNATAGSLLKLLHNNAPNFNVDGIIMADMMDKGFSITPLLLGNRQVMQFARSQNASGLNGDGLNLNQMTRFNAFYDKNVVEANCAPETDGNDVMLAIIPQLVNLLSWSENAGIFASRQSINWDSLSAQQLISQGDSYMHTVVTDPATGLLFDLDLIYDPSCKGLTYHMKSYYKSLILPLQGCVNGFKGIIKYDVCPEATPTC